MAAPSNPTITIKKDSVDGFKFGTSITSVFNWIRKNHEKPEFKYNEEDPFSEPYRIRLKSRGLCLIFNSKTQLLEKIIIDNLDSITLRYNGTFLSSSTKRPNLTSIHKTFGAMQPGSKSAEGYVVETNLDRTQQNPTRLRFIFPSEQEELKCIECISPKNIHMTTKKISVNIEDGIVSFTDQVSLSFGASVQEVIIALGPPDQKYTKPLNLVDSTENKVKKPLYKDYFFNYFTLGIDILFDGKNHNIKKFILWNNMPSHEHFSIYSKCHFVLKKDADDDVNEEDYTLDTIEDRFGKPSNTYNYTFSPSCIVKYHGFGSFIVEVMENGCISRVFLFKGNAE